MTFMTDKNTLFAVIDFQEKLMPAMFEKEYLEDRATKLIAGMRVLGIPTVVTQQYTKGIGPTIPSVAAALGEFEHIEKTCFSCMRNADFSRIVDGSGAENVVLCGIETHICVQQTALQLIDRGFRVYVPFDCVSSRTNTDKLCGIGRIENAGGVITSYEAVLYELLQDSTAEHFKEISALVK